MADNTPRPSTPPAQVGQRDNNGTGSAAGGQKEFAVSPNPTMNNDNPNVQRTSHEDDGQGDQREKNPKHDKSSAHPTQREDDGNPNGTRSSSASNGAGTP